MYNKLGIASKLKLVQPFTFSATDASWGIHQEKFTITNPIITIFQSMIVALRVFMAIHNPFAVGQVTDKDNTNAKHGGDRYTGGWCGNLDVVWGRFVANDQQSSTKVVGGVGNQ
jgi:hypothetical protein